MSSGVWGRARPNAGSPEPMPAPAREPASTVVQDQLNADQDGLGGTAATNHAFGLARPHLDDVRGATQQPGPGQCGAPAMQDQGPATAQGPRPHRCGGPRILARGDQNQTRNRNQQ